MVDSGFVVPTGNLVVKGSPASIVYRNLGVATNGYPGRLAVREATDYDVKVSDGLLPPIGWIGYEQQAIQYQVESKTTINVVDTEVPILSRGGFTIYVPSGLAAGTIASQGDILLSWANGQMVPGVELGGKYAVKIPFSQNATVKDTLIDIPGGVLIRDCMINVTTGVSASSIDVGFENATESGDLDGILDGESCVNTGLVLHNTVDATGSANTLGVLLVESDILDATAVTPVTYSVPNGYVTNGTIKSLVYTTSAHAVAGFIYLFVESPGIVPVGIAGAAADASTTAAGVFVETSL